MSLCVCNVPLNPGKGRARPCDVNRHRPSVSWPAMKTEEREDTAEDFYNQSRGGQMELTAQQ